MKIIGLTGGIGSGKSTAALFLTDLGAEVIDLDKVGHDVLERRNKAYQRLLEEFGEGILDAKGEIDRTKLGRIVFSDPKALQRLNNIVHPEIDKIVEKNIEESRRKQVKVLVFEAAALLEAEKTWQVDEVWAILADEQAVLDRLKGRSGYSELDIKARIHAQMTNEERIKHANVVIYNNGTLKELKANLEREWEKLHQRL